MSEYNIAKDMANLELRVAQLAAAVEELYSIIKPEEKKK